jgi:hypothetical protein
MKRCNQAAWQNSKLHRKIMKVLNNLCMVAVALGLTPAALADKYDDLAAKGYRWVTVDGPYGFRSRDDVHQIVKDRGEGNEVKSIEQLRTYYLLPGTIVQLIQKDAASGTSQIQLKRVSRPLWTLSKFLGVRPITDLDGKIEIPLRSGDNLDQRN